MNTEYKIHQLKQYLKEKEEKKHLQKVYTPFRRYRKGDIVRARLYGRGFLWAKDSQIFHVAKDEKEGDPAIMMEESSLATGKQVHLNYAEIELITPVEENRPFDLNVIEAVRRMTDDHKIIERPRQFLNGTSDCSLIIQIRYVDKKGFQIRVVNSIMNSDWKTYHLEKNDIEAKWREAEEGNNK